MFPNFDWMDQPEPAQPKPRHRSKRKGLESSVQRACLQLLISLPDIVYLERRNTGAVQFESGRMLRFGRKGAADIWCLIRRPTLQSPQHVEIECKRSDGKGRLSAAQREFQVRCETIGVPYLLVVSVEDLASQLHGLGLNVA